MKKLIKDINEWLMDMDGVSANGADLDIDTFEGSAYQLLVRAKRELQKLNKK